MKRTLLIDIGSTSIKWTIKLQSSHVESIQKIPFPQKILLPEPYFEVDINKIVNIIKNIIDYHGKTCESLLIATQMHGYILSDKKMNPVTNYISWQDKRAVNTVYPFNIDSSYGTSAKTNLPKISIYHMKLAKPELMRRVYYFDTLGSYIIYQLTGVHQTHITDAAASGFYDIVNHVTDETPFKLPLATDEIKVVGQYKTINVYPAVGDHQASIFSLEQTDDTYILNMGTAAQICCVSDSYVPGEFESRPYFHKKTLCTITNLFGGKEFASNNKINKIELFKQYNCAIKKLPLKHQFIVMGGALHYHMDMIDKIVCHIATDIKYDKQAQAILGLAKLAEELK